MKIEINTYSTLSERVTQIKAQIAEYVEAYETNKGSKPDRVLLRFDDYQALAKPAVSAVNNAAREEARARFHAERAKRKAAKWAEYKPTPVEVEAMTFAGIPLIKGAGYSRPRTVKSA